MQTHLNTVSVSGGEGFSPLPGMGKWRAPFQGEYMHCFVADQGRAESTSCTLYLFHSQLSSPQNNPYTKMAYFEVAYSDPLQQHI